jgi:hypothetical protein
MEMSPLAADSQPPEAPHLKRTIREWLRNLITRTSVDRVADWIRGGFETPASTGPVVGIDMSPGLPTKLQYFKLFRAYRLREHDLLNHRLTWYLTIQGFLFVTYGYCVQKPAEIEVGENGANPCSASYAVAQLNK